MLSGSSTSGGVGVGVGLRRGTGGGSPSVGATRSTGRCAGVGVGLGDEAGTAGCVLRGRSWFEAADTPEPNRATATNKQQTASTAIHRAWCSLNLSRFNETLGTLFISDKTLREPRSEEHTSELQSQSNLVCRLLL